MPGIGWIFLCVVLVLVGLTFFVKSKILRVLIAFALFGAVIEREISFGAYARYISWQKAQQGVWTEQFRDGLMEMLHHVHSSTFYALGLYFLLMILYFHCLFGKNRNSIPKSS